MFFYFLDNIMIILFYNKLTNVGPRRKLSKISSSYLQKNLKGLRNRKYRLWLFFYRFLAGEENDPRHSNSDTKIGYRPYFFFKVKKREEDSSDYRACLIDWKNDRRGKF